MKVSDNNFVGSFSFDLVGVMNNIFFFICFVELLYVSIVFALILTVSFARAMVRYVFGSATSARSSSVVLKFLTTYTNMGGGLGVSCVSL